MKNISFFLLATTVLLVSCAQSGSDTRDKLDINGTSLPIISKSYFSYEHTGSEMPPEMYYYFEIASHSIRTVITITHKCLGKTISLDKQSDLFWKIRIDAIDVTAGSDKEPVLASGSTLRVDKIGDHFKLVLKAINNANVIYCQIREFAKSTPV